MTDKHKPKYVTDSENKLWKWFNDNQHRTFTFTEAAELHSLSESDFSKLRLLWSTGQRDSFNQAYYSLYEGSPTKF